MKVIRAMEMNKSRRGDEALRKDADCREDEEHFEGNVWMQAMLPPIRPSQLRANLITFEPKARTNWHTHPEFQILYVVAGKGRIRSSDESGHSVPLTQLYQHTDRIDSKQGEPVQSKSTPIKLAEAEN